jgi:hypothetical protein
LVDPIDVTPEQEADPQLLKLGIGPDDVRTIIRTDCMRIMLAVCITFPEQDARV